MRDSDSHWDFGIVKRRRLIKTVGGTGVALTIAGCMGDEEPDVGEGNGNGNGNGTEEEVIEEGDADVDDIDPDEWPNLEDHEVHILTQESSDEYQDYWRNLAGRFNYATDASVRMEYTGFGVGLQERIAQLIQGGDPPELSHLGHPGVATYGDLGLLADHSEAVEHWENRWGEIPDGARFLIDGQDQFLPLLTNIKTNWYRADVFDEVPDTWETQLAMAEEHDEGDGGIRGAAYPMAIGDTNITQIKLYSYGWSNGVQFFDREGGDGEVYPAFAEEYLNETVETLEFMRDVYQYSDPNLDVGGGDFIQLVGNERAYQAGWVGARPKFYGEGTDFGEHIRPCTWPGRDGNHTPWGHVQGYTAFEDSDTEAALEFLKFWAEPENFIGFYFADPIHNAPIIEEIRDSEHYQNELEQLPDYWNVPEDLPFDWIDQGHELPAETEPPNEHTGLIYDSQEMIALVRDVCADEVDPEQAVQDRADNIRQVIEDA